MLTCGSFIDQYWAHYISMEKEFFNTIKYASLNIENYNTFSEAYSKLMLEIGSEVDVILKVFCKLLQPAFSGNSIKDYMALINIKVPDFSTQEVKIESFEIKVQPWINWNNSVGSISPYWWTAYNKIKHDRTGTGTIDGITKEYFKFGNQKNTLLALAGLYQILIFTYYILATAENKKVLVPLPGSRIFELTGGIWDSIIFFKDFALYLDSDTGEMHMEISTVFY